jgi:hypothetical protein
MSFDNYYPKRKDWRRQYFKSKRFDRSCRPGGSCPYCISNRLYTYRKRISEVNYKIKELVTGYIYPIDIEN